MSNTFTFTVDGTLVNIINTGAGAELLFMPDSTYVGQQFRVRMWFNLSSDATGTAIADKYRSVGCSTNAHVQLELTDAGTEVVSVTDL